MPRKTVCETMYNFVIWCCYRFGLQTPEVDKYEHITTEDCQDMYEYLCEQSNIPEIESLLLYFDDLYNFDHESAFLIACKNGDTPLVKWFLKEKLKINLNKGLEMSVKNNHYDTAETLVKAGANIMIGLRHSSSVNITRMLYRHKQNTENITT